MFTILRYKPIIAIWRDLDGKTTLGESYWIMEGFLDMCWDGNNDGEESNGSAQMQKNTKNW